MPSSEHPEPVRAALDAVERRDDGLYINDGIGVHVTTGRSSGSTRPAVYVDAEDFMRVQKERDDLKRVLYLINGWCWGSGRAESTLVRLLAQAGLTELDGQTCRSLVDDVRRDARSSRDDE
jgi:hypothetical protein